MEIREVKVKQVDEKCPACQQGWMRPTGVVLPTNPLQYDHKCTLCTHKQIYGVRFPYTV